MYFTVHHEENERENQFSCAAGIGIQLLLIHSDFPKKPTLYNYMILRLVVNWGVRNKKIVWGIHSNDDWLPKKKQA